jgi:hypothetical protein
VRIGARELPEKSRFRKVRSKVADHLVLQAPAFLEPQAIMADVPGRWPFNHSVLVLYAIRRARFDIGWLENETVEAISHAEILYGAVQRVDDLIVPEI